jgi:phage/conjugal plasmid C-4 type zinc finger TraR family protein
MATGWAHEGAVLDQIHDTISGGVESARARLPHGASAMECVECGDEIPEKRRNALPGVTTCIACQTDRDARVTHALFNRRGSKASQLK